MCTRLIYKDKDKLPGHGDGKRNPLVKLIKFDTPNISLLGEKSETSPRINYLRLVVVTNRVPVLLLFDL